MKRLRKNTGQAGVQQWSRGDIFPATIVIKGIGVDQVIVAKHGDWIGNDFSVSNLGFQEAHKRAEKQAVKYLKQNNLY